MTDSGRQSHCDGAGWEQQAGYARAVKMGPWIHVSGTTATDVGGQALHSGDTYQQTLAAVHRGLEAVKALGGVAGDVVRTRLYLAPLGDWKSAARAHGEVFGDIAPANTTLYVHALIGDGFLVEAEIDAYVGDQ